MKNFFLIGILLPAVCLAAYADDLKPGDKAAYRFFQGGLDLGPGSYEVVAAAGGGIEIRCAVELESPAGSVSIKSTTTLGDENKIKRYTLTATLPSGNQELDISFTGGKAQAAVVIGGNRAEPAVELPEEWIILDNNSPAHMALLAARRMKPGMAPETGKVFVPQNLRVFDYTLEHAGEAEYEIAGAKTKCRHFKMNLAGIIDVDFYVADGRMLAMEQTAQQVKIVLVR